MVDGRLFNVLVCSRGGRAEPSSLYQLNWLNCALVHQYWAFGIGAARHGGQYGE